MQDKQDQSIPRTSPVPGNPDPAPESPAESPVAKRHIPPYIGPGGPIGYGCLNRYEWTHYFFTPYAFGVEVDPE